MTTWVLVVNMFCSDSKKLLQTNGNVNMATHAVMRGKLVIIIQIVLWPQSSQSEPGHAKLPITSDKLFSNRLLI